MKLVTAAAAAQSVVGKWCHYKNRTLCRFGACCKLKDPSEGTGGKNGGSVMRTLKQHMLLSCTSTLKTGFYSTLFPLLLTLLPLY